MTILFLIFVVVVVLHFVIEGIIAPSERNKIRLELFTLRDEVRRTKIEAGREFNDELYDHMESHVNKSIRLLHNYNIVGLFQAIRESRKDSDMFKKAKQRTARFYELLGQSSIPRVDAMHVRNLIYTLKGSFFNSLGWLPYLTLPLLMILGVILVTRMYGKVRRWCGFAITSILELPERTFDRLFPGTSIKTI